LADYIDVFCETGFFSPEETEIVCRAGMSYGLKPKIHANHSIYQAAWKLALNSMLFLSIIWKRMDAQTISLLAKSNTIGTLLPTAAFFLRMPFQPARQLIDAGCAIAPGL
jgi:imidazolonepropionase